MNITTKIFQNLKESEEKVKKPYGDKPEEGKKVGTPSRKKAAVPRAKGNVEKFKARKMENRNKQAADIYPSDTDKVMDNIDSKKQSDKGKIAARNTRKATREVRKPYGDKVQPSNSKLVKESAQRREAARKRKLREWVKLRARKNNLRESLSNKVRPRNLKESAEKKTKKLEESIFQGYEDNIRKYVEDAILKAFDGTDFSVSVNNIDFDNGTAELSVYALGPAEEEDGDAVEYEREITLEIPALNLEERINDACEDWMSKHRSPDEFYEGCEPKKEEKTKKTKKK